MKLKKLRKYCIDNHRKMWNWLADNPDKNKKDWPGWEKCDIDLPPNEINHCFLCGYVELAKDGKCIYCTLALGVTDMCVRIEPEWSYYMLYKDSVMIADKTKYARIIANLPEKDDIEELIIKDAMRRC